MANIHFIKDHPGIIGQRAPARSLPQTCNTWSGSQVVRRALPVFAYLFSDDGPRTNKTHLSHKDVEDLRNLVKAGSSKHSTDRSNSRVVAQLASHLPLNSCLGIALE